MSEELRRGIPKPIVIGHIEFTAEEKAQNRKDLEEILREIGVLKENENLDDTAPIGSDTKKEKRSNV